MHSHPQEAVPNLYWQAISTDQLRQHPRFSPLLPVSQVQLHDYHSCSRIRQHSRAWSDLHPGVLTTGYIKEALGFKEPKAAQQLGASNQAGHAALLRAVAHLQQQHSPLLQRVTALHTTTRHCSRSPQPLRTEQQQQPQQPQSVATAQHADTAASELAAALGSWHLTSTSTSTTLQQQPAPAAYTEWLPNTSSRGHSAAASSKSSRRRRKKQAKQLAAGVGAAAASAGTGTADSLGHTHDTLVNSSASANAVGQPQGTTSSTMYPHSQAAAAPAATSSFSLASAGYDSNTDEEDELADPDSCFEHCRATAAAGLTSVCCAWGKVQEAAALQQLLDGFPDAVGEEAGLHLLSPNDLPSAWGGNSSNLPLLGATPDGFLCHALPLPVRLTQQQAAAVRLVLAALAARDGAAAAAALATLHGQVAGIEEQKEQEQQLVEEEQQQQAAALEQLGAGGIWQQLLSWLQVQLPGPADAASSTPATAGAAAASKGVAAAVDPSADTCSTAAQPGSSSTTTQANKQLSDTTITSSLNGSSSSSSRLVGTHSAVSAGAAFTSSLNGSNSSSSSQGGTRSAVSPGAAITAAVRGLVPAGVNAALVDRGLRQYLFVREVMEVKNHCPFQVAQLPPSRKGRARTRYLLQDRGPRRRLPPMWVPQLQLHMVATGCSSALLISRSATQGTTVFRVAADELYVRRMLAYASRCYTSFVLSRSRPQPNNFWGEGTYQTLLQHTRGVAASAVVVGCLESAAAGQEDGRGQQSVQSRRDGGCQRSTAAQVTGQPFHCCS